ncbi:hypothetical protein [Mycobacterium kyogaense]|uniref:hypothetical protein n=1 Tax=Mycobacterium kyogaense TaxID=2212479 RepID=UPI002FFA4071
MKQDVVAINLADDERTLLLAGLLEFGGPAMGSRVVAPIVGAANLDQFFELTDRLRASIAAGEPLSGLDWTRALVLTEICWASDVLGAASDFGMNLTDDGAVRALRSLQRKIVTGERVTLLLESARTA